MTSIASRLGRTPLLVLVLLLAACSGAPADPPPTSSASGSGVLPSEDRLRAALESALAGSGVPGGAVVVTDADGGSATAVFGERAPGEPVTADTRFAYRSITKSFVGTVILQLADEKRLSLEDPVSKYVAGVPNGDRITIAELGDMRSGLANYSAQPGLGAMLSKDPARDPKTSELLALSYAVKSVAPGTAYEYSNTNTLLLGEVIRKVTGDDWATAVDQRLLRPLKLESVRTGFVAGSENAAGFQLADGKIVEQLPVVAPGWFGAAGALTGNAADLATWGRSLGSGSLVSQDAQRWRLEQFGSTADDPASPLYDDYGFAMGRFSGWIGHTGTGLGFQGLVMYDPATQHVISVLINGTGENPDLPVTVFQAVRKL